LVGNISNHSTALRQFLQVMVWSGLKSKAETAVRLRYITCSQFGQPYST
jgi:hypothetical protein